MSASSSSLSEGETRTAGDGFASEGEALRARRLLRNPRLRNAASLLQEGQLKAAVRTLDEFLKLRPRDADALYLRAEAALRLGVTDDAENLLAQCIGHEPLFLAARLSFATLLLQTHKTDIALSEADYLLQREPANPLFRRLKALALEATENFVGAAELWRALVKDYPDNIDCRVRLGHALRSLGNHQECIANYRKAIELGPSHASAWWALADLKTFRFEARDIEQMETQLLGASLATEERIRLHFSLGKAYAGQGLYEKSFGNYSKANALQSLGIKHDPEFLTNYLAACRRVFTDDLFRARTGDGCKSSDPIFIVGMLRSGSTLVEQILASHPLIEGTRELCDLPAVSKYAQTNFVPRDGARYPRFLENLCAEDLQSLGERYLASTRLHRSLGRPFFTDKTGTNFVHTGLIHLILPNAKIVDVRRHPLACGFSIFSQLFPPGVNHAYRLADIGRLYHDYVELMAHFNRELPGKIHHISYESLVADPETAIRDLLAYVGVPFDSACLEFYRNDRAVVTVSSEQVRTPIYKNALEFWRNYEPWLGPLIKSLGSVLTCYPDVPAEVRSASAH